MKVLWLTQGVTGHDRRFTSLLTGAGHQVPYLALDPAPEPPRLAAGVEWVPWPERPAGDLRTPQEVRAAVDPFRRLLERLRPDVVHAGPVPTAGFLAASAGARPLVVMSWGSDLLVDAGRSAEWREASGSALEAADIFVCDADAVLARAEAFADLSGKRIVQLPWGTDLQRFTPAGSPSPVRVELGWGQNFVVLSTRSWEPIYGVEVLLEAFRSAVERTPRLRLLLIGDGSLRPAVDGFLHKHGLQELVHTPGAVSHEVLPEWFRAADIYASCAFSDGTSVSLLEGMASGLPVLVTDIPSNREWVAPGENGWLAPSHDARAVAAAMEEAAALPASALEEIGARNRRVARARADWEANGARLIEAYDGLEGARF